MTTYLYRLGKWNEISRENRGPPNCLQQPTKRRQSNKIIVRPKFALQVKSRDSMRNLVRSKETVKLEWETMVEEPLEILQNTSFPSVQTSI